MTDTLVPALLYTYIPRTMGGVYAFRRGPYRRLHATYLSKGTATCPLYVRTLVIAGRYGTALTDVKTDP